MVKTAYLSSVMEPLTCATSFSQVSRAFNRSSSAAASDEEPLPTCLSRRSCFFNSFAVACSGVPVVIASLHVRVAAVACDGVRVCLCDDRSRLSRRLISPNVLLRMRLRGVREKRSSLRLLCFVCVVASSGEAYLPAEHRWSWSSRLLPALQQHWSQSL